MVLDWRLPPAGWCCQDSQIRILDLTTQKVSTVSGSDGMFSPRWSPDGRYLAALSTISGWLMFYDFQTQKSDPSG